MLGKLLGLATVGSTLASLGLLNRFLSGIASIIILSIVSAFMLCGLVAGGFYLAYTCLVQYGLDPSAAGITVGVVALFLTAALIVLTLSQIRKMRDMIPGQALPRYTGMPDMVQIADAFVEGFLNPRK